MIRFVLSLAFSLAVLFSFAQNLVPNPSFELTTLDCEPNPGLQGWYSPNLATPDIFTLNEEDCGTFLSEQLVEELDLILPLSGNNMAGLFCAYPETSNQQSRDYLTCKLSENLSQGEVYRVSFYSCRWHLGNYAIDQLGVYFSEDSMFFDTGEMLPVMPVWESNVLHSASFEWTEYEFFYTAMGGERYMTFGCFRDYDEMQVVDLQTSTTDWNNAYYLFDDFVVERGVGIAHVESFIFEVSVAHSVLNVISNERGVLVLSNSQGQIIQQVTVQPGENQILLSSPEAGLYTATFNSETRRKSARFFWH
jgi:hypothetical protein